MSARTVLAVAAESWPLASAFRIARGAKTSAETVVVTLSRDGVSGHGECVPYARYGETVAGTIADIEKVQAEVEAGLARGDLARLLPAGAARNALDCALWDLEAKEAGKPAWRLAGLGQPPAPVTTCYTLGIDTPDAMREAARKAASRPLLKVKLGAGAEDLDRIRAVREGAPKARLVIDANEGWDIDTLARLDGPLADLGVEMIEQPIPAADDAALAGFAHKVPICADESCHTSADVAALAGRYDMVNLKLDKTGGLTEALALADAARTHGLGLMVGCMVATSLAMAPAMLVAQGAAVVDLDGPLLLARDRVPGLRFEGSTVHPPEPALWG